MDFFLVKYLALQGDLCYIVLEMNLDNWTTQVRKGLLELCIMNVLDGGEVYGYDLIKRLSAVEGLVVTEGTIYPLLSRLRKMGLVETQLKESSAGHARKYYTLTRKGREFRDLMNTYWNELAAGVDTLNGGKRNG